MLISRTDLLRWLAFLNSWSEGREVAEIGTSSNRLDGKFRWRHIGSSPRTIEGNLTKFEIGMCGDHRIVERSD